MSKLSKLLLLFICMFCASLAFSQDRKTLEKQKNQLKQDIAYKAKLLEETNKSKSQSLNQLVLLRKKIELREQLIATIKSEIEAINFKIAETEAIIQALERDLVVLKEEYAKMIFYAYKNRSAYDKLMFVFASKDFNQAFKRLKYLQQYAQFRQKQADIITITQSELSRKKKEMEGRRIEKELLLRNEEQEKNHLAIERKEKNSLFANLSTQEKALKEEIKKKEREALALQKAIERVIAEEIRKQKEAEKKKGVLELTPEAKLLSSNFESNKGKLPWPVNKGVITEGFGEHAHPILRGIKTNNNGLNISTDKGALARAVFEGEVIAVLVFPGAGKAIMIRHGEYISVYSNLEEVFVKSGDKIKTKQELGKVITDSSKGKTEVHFEIWKGQTPQNPSTWMYKAT